MTDIRGLLTDDDAVSPVIGVILMVAVTVILSAAIGAFVLDIGNAVTEQQPNAVIEFEFDIASGGADDAVILRHNGGDELATSALRVTVDGAIAWEDGSPESDFTEATADWDDGVTSGDELRLEESSSVQLVWQKGQRSSIIASTDS